MSEWDHDSFSLAVFLCQIRQLGFYGVVSVSDALLIITLPLLLLILTKNCHVSMLLLLLQV